MGWMAAFYQKLLTSRIKKEGFDNFICQYQTILQWMEIDLPNPLPQRPCPETESRQWLEYVSDAIHFHRRATGLPTRDEALQPLVTRGDCVRETPEKPPFEYQVALDGLRSLFNVGSIFRTCEAAGIGTVILGNTLGKAHPNVRKTAMGAEQWITEEKSRDLAATLEKKRSEGFRIIGVETVSGSVPCHEYAWPPKAVLVFGNEEYGISSHVLGGADAIVHIPMFGKKNSLNVANAAAAVIFQAALCLSPSAS